MADYKSAYTGAEIDTKLGQIKTQNEIQTMINSSISGLGMSVTFPSGTTSVTTLGKGLIIQTMDIALGWRIVETRSFPQAFPHMCLFIIVAPSQCGDSGTDGYWVAQSIQYKIISTSQYRTFMNSDATNAGCSARVIAVGY